MASTIEPLEATLTRDLFFGAAPEACATHDDDYADHEGDGSDMEDVKPDLTGAKSKKRMRSPSTTAKATPTPRKKTIRVPGGRAAVPRRIHANYDSEDEIIVTMKQQGYSNEAVQKRLIEEGMTKYDVKTIPSRWLRIRKALQYEEEERLDDELTDWHDGEDERLLQSYDRAYEKIEQEHAKLEAKFWTYVGFEINHGTLRPRFSGKACEKRYLAIMDGTARPPPELDSNPEGRRIERDQRIKEKEMRKLEEEEQLAIEAEEKAKIKDEEEHKKELRRQIRAAETAERRKKRQEEADFKANKNKVKQEARDEIRRRKEAGREMLRSEKEEKKAAKEFLMRHKIEHKDTALYQRKHNEADKRAAIKERRNRQPTRRARLVPYHDTVATVLARMQGKGETVEGFSQNVAAPEPGAEAHPRGIMNTSELRSLVRNRGIPLTDQKPTKQIMLNAIEAWAQKLKAQEVAAVLMDKGIRPVGSHKKMIRMLADADARDSANYRPEAPVKNKTTGAGKRGKKSTPIKANRRVTRGAAAQEAVDLAEALSESSKTPGPSMVMDAPDAGHATPLDEDQEQEQAVGGAEGTQFGAPAITSSMLDAYLQAGAAQSYAETANHGNDDGAEGTIDDILADDIAAQGAGYCHFSPELLDAATE